MSGLTNRNNLVDYFHRHLSSFVIESASLTQTTLVHNDGSKIFIDKNTGNIEFYKKLSCEYSYDDFNPYGSCISKTASIESLALIMISNTDTSFSIVSASDDEWAAIRVLGVNTEHCAIDTVLNMTYKKLPTSGTEYYQRSRPDNPVLDLEHCLKVKGMCDKIITIGGIVKVSSSLKINLLFEENLRNGTKT